MGGRLTRDAAPSRPSKIETRMVQAMAERAQSGKFGLKSFNSIIMKFPKIDKSFQDVRAVFKKFGKLQTGLLLIDMSRMNQAHFHCTIHYLKLLCTNSCVLHRRCEW